MNWIVYLCSMSIFLSFRLITLLLFSIASVLWMFSLLCTFLECEIRFFFFGFFRPDCWIYGAKFDFSYLHFIVSSFVYFAKILKVWQHFSFILKSSFVLLSAVNLWWKQQILATWKTSPEIIILYTYKIKVSEAMCHCLSAKLPREIFNWLILISLQKSTCQTEALVDNK